MDYTKTEYEEPLSYPFSDSHVQFEIGYVIPCFPESHGLDFVVHMDRQMEKNRSGV